MEQAGVVRVLDVLEHQLPVRRHRLALVAEHAQLPSVEDAVEPADVGRSEVVLERRQAAVERGKDDAVTFRHRQSLEPVVAIVEVDRHPSITAHPTLEWQPE